MFYSTSAILLVAFAAAGSSVVAQSLSQGCEAGLAGLALNSDASCLNVQGLVGVLAAGDNTSLVDPINTWLGGFCSQPQCSNDTLASVVNTVTTACSAELSSFGLTNVSPAQLSSLVQSLFPVAKGVACLQDQSNNTLCATETLRGYETVNGPFTVDALTKLLGEIKGSAVPPSVPQSTECSSCAKQAYNVLTQQFPGVINSDAQQNIQQTCGADFTDGQTPSGVSSTANTALQNSDTSNTSGAVTSVSGAAGAVLSILATFFAVAV
ncbi:hypothetical protein BDW22DRAFT_1354871 [Trametopsis cervina]|nr:hypothetical protein BDW22DRAFT_1354871 [Trametopsis cervina]